MADGSEVKLPTLTAIELEKYLTLKEGAKLKSLSRWTFKKHYGHVFEKVSPGRQAVKLRKLLTAEPR
jgi:hypothetical protein